MAKVFKEDKKKLTDVKPGKFVSLGEQVEHQGGGAYYNLESLSGDNARNDFSVDYLKQKIAETQDVELKIDYSDFSNHVFFSNAEEILRTGLDKIMTEYPLTASVSEFNHFWSGLSGYEKFLFNEWDVTQKATKWNRDGYAVASAGNPNSKFLDPLSGPWTVEFWMKDVECIYPQHVDARGGFTSGSAPIIYKGPRDRAAEPNGWGVFMSSSAQAGDYNTHRDIEIEMDDGRRGFRTKVADIPSNVEKWVHLAITFDGDDTFKSYVTGVHHTTTTTGALYNKGTSISSKNHLTFMSGGIVSEHSMFIPQLSGALDEIRIWNEERSHKDIISNYDQQIMANSESLVGYWRFNHRFPTPGHSTSSRDFSYDNSGHGNWARNIDYTEVDGPSFVDSTLLKYGIDRLKYYDLQVVSGSGVNRNTQFVADQHYSASSYDDNNRAQILNLVPNYVLEQDLDPYAGGNGFMHKFLQVMAREFDVYKMFIDHLPYLLTSKHSDYNKTPDALLPLIGDMFGFPLESSYENFVSDDWISGVRQTGSYDTVVKDLQSLNNVFWQRMLTNLPYLAKHKGTKESLEAIFRIYGVPPDIFKIKEYVGAPAKIPHGISDLRTKREKALDFSFTGSEGYDSHPVVSFASSSNLSTLYLEEFSVESRFRLHERPTSTNFHTIWHMSGAAHTSPYDIADANMGVGHFSLVLDTTNISTGTASLVLRAKGEGLINGEVIPKGTDIKGEWIIAGSEIAPFSSSCAYQTAVVMKNTGEYYGDNESKKFNGTLYWKRVDTDCLEDNVVVQSGSRAFSTPSGSYEMAINIGESTSTSLPNDGWFNGQIWNIGSGSMLTGSGNSLGKYIDDNFSGSISQFRFWSKELSDEEIERHTLNFSSIATTGGLDSFIHCTANVPLDDNSDADVNGELTVVDLSGNSVTGTGTGFMSSSNPFNAFDVDVVSLWPYFDDYDVGLESLRTYHTDRWDRDPTQPNEFAVSLEGNLIEEVSRDQVDLIFTHKTVDNAIANFPGKAKKKPDYPIYDAIRREYYQKRWKQDSSLLINEFNKTLEYIALNLHKVFENFIPARAQYLGTFFVIEPHFLERQRHSEQEPRNMMTPVMQVGDLSLTLAENLDIIPTDLHYSLEIMRKTV